jgi:REP element-mobilizing transposase RayT
MKPKNYTQLHFQLIFAVKYRRALLTDDIRDEVFKYMGGILTEMGHKPYIINGPSNHVHILLGFNPNKTVSETVQHLKRNTSLFINRQRLCPMRFAWQEGYGAFSYSKSQLGRVDKYIKNQVEHHRRKSFREEYLKCLQNHDLDYNDRYLFDFMDDI